MKQEGFFRPQNNFGIIRVLINIARVMKKVFKDAGILKESQVFSKPKVRKK